MGFADRHGDAVVNPQSPAGFGVCDDCGRWTNLNRLKKQMEWQGPKIAWIGTLVCRTCVDVPQPQLRPIKLPADPVPLINPRPEAFSLIDRPSGFSQYTMWPQGQPLLFGVELYDGNGNPILDGNGDPILIEIGSDGPALLAQLVEMTGITVPGTIQNYGGTITTAEVAQILIPASATRSYIAIFNPCTAPIYVSTGTAAPGVAPAMMLGSGGCLFWATAQGFGQPYTGAMTVVGYFAECPVYAFSD